MTRLFRPALRACARRRVSPRVISPCGRRAMKRMMKSAKIAYRHCELDLSASGTIVKIAAPTRGPKTDWVPPSST